MRRLPDKFTVAVGQIFGRWEIMVAGSGSGTKVLCKCLCGAEKPVLIGMLVIGDSRSCGCLVRDTAAIRSRKHGMHKSPEYCMWSSMKAKHVGLVDPTWMDFGLFISDVGKRPTPQHTIVRWPNQSGRYEPGNVRWATIAERFLDRGPIISYDGRRFSLPGFAREFGIATSTIRYRHRLGLRGADLLTRRKSGPPRTKDARLWNVINGSAAWGRARRVVRRRDRNRCRLCGSNNRLQYHHIIPLRHAPSLATEPWNIILLCYACHAPMWGRELERSNNLLAILGEAESVQVDYYVWNSEPAPRELAMAARLTRPPNHGGDSAINA